MCHSTAPRRAPRARTPRFNLQAARERFYDATRAALDQPEKRDEWLLPDVTGPFWRAHFFLQYLGQDVTTSARRRYEREVLVELDALEKLVRG